MTLLHKRIRHMTNLDFSKEDQAAIVQRIQEYFLQEFELDMGGLEAESVMEFIAGEIGGHFYNRGLYDAQSVFTDQIELINDAIYQLERPTGA